MCDKDIIIAQFKKSHHYKKFALDALEGIVERKMKEKELYSKVDKLYKAVQSLREELKLQEAPYGRDYHQSRRPSNKEDSGSGSNCGGGHC